MDLASITAILTALKGSVDILKGVKDLLPQGEQRASIESAIEEVEASTELALADLGKQFGYRMCRCQIPPTPMLTTGELTDVGVEIERCPKCGKEYPPDIEGGGNLTIRMT